LAQGAADARYRQTARQQGLRERAAHVARRSRDHHSTAHLYLPAHAWHTPAGDRATDREGDVGTRAVDLRRTCRPPARSAEAPGGAGERVTGYNPAL